MSAATDALVAKAKSAGTDEALKVVAQMRGEFISAFAGFITAEDLLKLDELLVKAIKYKAAQFTASTDKEAQEAVDEYEGVLETIETIGDQYEIIAKAKAGKLVRSLAHALISGAFAVGGAVLQVGMGILVPGIGSLVGAGVNAGLQHAVSYFMGD